MDGWIDKATPLSLGRRLGPKRSRGRTMSASKQTSPESRELHKSAALLSDLGVPR